MASARARRIDLRLHCALMCGVALACSAPRVGPTQRKARATSAAELRPSEGGVVNETCNTECPPKTHRQGGMPPEETLLWCQNDRGERQGPWVLWDADGDLIECGNYERGRPHGLWLSFEHGKVVTSTEYVRGYKPPLLVVTVMDSRGRPVGALVKATAPNSFFGQAFTSIAGSAAIPFPSPGPARIVVSNRTVIREMDVEILRDRITRVVVVVAALPERGQLPRAAARGEET